MVQTYTYTYTRAQAVVDQVDVLFGEAGIADARRAKVCNAVDQRWLEAVGLFLERDDRLVYEMEARITWRSDSDYASLEFSVDLPGWEGNGTPEALFLGRRFAKVAGDNKLAPRYWVRFTSAIRKDPARHKELCSVIGVVYSGSLPNWKATPVETNLPMQDLAELNLSIRSAL